ncbi:MAG: HEAT repeat domain-containing protein [Bryobacteraceae bacterium]
MIEPVGKAAFDRKLEALDAVRADPASASTGVQLRKALEGRNNYLAAKAARLAAELERKDLIGDLVSAFGHFLTDPVKTDPQCWAKTAIVKALKALEHDAPEVFLHGIGYVQREPAFGGSEDSAATLRGECAFGLIRCRSIPAHQVLARLVDLLTDEAKAPRIDAARALAAYGSPHSVLVLRLKIRMGDADPEVTGACLAAMMALDPEEGVPLAAQLLDGRDDDLRHEAAAALGESPDPAAFAALRHAWERTRDPEFRQTLLISIGSSRQPQAVDFLLSLINAADLTNAAQAVRALAPNRFSSAVRERVAHAVEGTRSERLAAVFKAEFT